MSTNQEIIGVKTNLGMELNSKYGIFLEDCSLGDEVFIAIRREGIFSAENRDRGSKCFCCVIDEVMYLGEGIRFINSTDHGHPFIMVKRTGDEAIKIKRGNKVNLWIDPKDVKVIGCPMS